MSGTGASRAERRQRIGFWLFGSHQWALFSIAASNILLGFTILAAPWAARRPTREDWARWRPLWIPAVVYLLWLLLSMVLSYDWDISRRAGGDIFNFTTILLALLLVRRVDDARRVTRGLILLTGALAVIGLVQYFSGYDSLDARMRATLSHYMTFAGVLLLGDCLLLAEMACGAWRKWWSWPLLVVINLALFLSYTRNTWVALAVVLTVLALTRLPRLLLVYVPVLVLVVLLAPLSLVQRAASIVDPGDPSNYDRLCMAYAGTRMIAERPLFGQGPEMVSERYAIYRHPTSTRFFVPHLHNAYLQVAAERGLPALAALLWLWGAAGGTAWRRLREEGCWSGPNAALYLGTLLALLGFAIAGLFEDNWADDEVQRILLFLLALPFCLPGGAVGLTRRSSTAVVASKQGAGR